MNLSSSQNIVGLPRYLKLGLVKIEHEFELKSKCHWTTALPQTWIGENRTLFWTQVKINLDPINVSINVQFTILNKKKDQLNWTQIDVPNSPKGSQVGQNFLYWWKELLQCAIWEVHHRLPGRSSQKHMETWLSTSWVSRQGPHAPMIQARS